MKHTPTQTPDFPTIPNTRNPGLSRGEVLDLYKLLHGAGVHDGGEAGGLAVVRSLCLTDLFYLLAVACHRDDVRRSDWLFDRCREVEANPNGFLDLWAREHYKSTIITFALTIQGVLANPNITVGIFSHTRPIAKGFLRQIKHEFETNDLLKAAFRDVLWDRPRSEAPKWGEDSGIIVRRTSNPKESTVEAHGLVDGQPTSRHYSLIVYDDVVTRESCTTPEQIQKTTEAWELSLNLASEGGKIRYIGTRYHYGDTYRTIMEREAAVPRVYPATTDGTPTGPPVLMSSESLATKRKAMGPYTFACQMLQDPKAEDTQGFREGWLQHWRPAGFESLNIYILVDPANAKKKDSDYTSIMVVGLGPDDNYYVVDMVRDRLNLTERTNRVIGLHRLYRPLGVFYEHYGMQADIQHLEYVQHHHNYRFQVTPVGENTPKPDRIRRLVPLFESGRVFLPDRCVQVDWERRQHDLVREFIDDEYLAFPVCVHDDMLDCLANIQDQTFVAMATWPDLDNPEFIVRPEGAGAVAATDYDLFGVGDGR